MTAGRQIHDDDLHAAADGLLPESRQRELEAHLAANPDHGARISFYRQVNSALHATYDAVLREPVPDRMLTRPRGRPIWRLVGRAAAAVVLIAMGAAGGWYGRDLAPPDAERDSAQLAALAASAYTAYVAEMRHPVEVPAEQLTHLEQWLSKRLDHQVQVPILAAVGYDFLGGRLLPAGIGVAGQLMYQNAEGNRVTLYFRRGSDERDSQFRYVAEDGLSTFYWRDDKFEYALSSELSRDQLLAVCNEVYAQLNPGGPAVDW
ncbi:MAG: anti-sigma factor family protein [Dongiaceae bacterium]